MRHSLAVVVLGVSVLGCGPAVHNEAAERARQWFHTPSTGQNDDTISEYRGILDRHSSSLQAGVVFPDWGYGCLSMDNPAESAHWTPFLHYGASHVLKRYPKPYSERGAQLVAFLFGIASHQVADEQWHSLSGLRDGLMQVLANSTFNGEYSRAHDALDVGGDFAMAHMSDLRYILDKWSVPVDDVMEIYEAMGVGVVAKWKMQFCLTRQFYAMEAVKRFGRGLFPSYASRAPILTERLDDYYVGGLFAMATSTCNCWEIVAGWLETGDFSKSCLVRGHRQPRHEGGNATAVHLDRSPAQAILDYMWPPPFGQIGGDISEAVTADEVDGVLHISLNSQSLFPEPLLQTSHGGGEAGKRQHVFEHT
ncbi:hypothetical protein GGI21_002704, partial [Coemansia aciculifera]